MRLVSRRVFLPLIAIAALGCATGSGSSRGRPAAEAVEAPCAGATCEEVARRYLLAGEERTAAARLFRGCDGGEAASCAALAVLFHEGRGVRRDDARACELGLGDACVAVGRPRPAREILLPEPLPVAGKQADPAPHVVTTERALAWGAARVLAGARERLGFTPEALREIPAAPMQDAALVNTIVAGARSLTVGRCVPGGALGYVGLVLAADGTVASAHVEVPDHPTKAESVACAERIVRAWDFPRPVTGGRVWVELVGAGRNEAVGAPVVDAPAFATGAYRKPEVTNDCIRAEVAAPLPRALRVGDGPITVKFAVFADGSVGLFTVLTRGLTEEIGDEIARRLETCRWIPGRDASGQPATVWVLLPLRFPRGD